MYCLKLEDIGHENNTVNNMLLKLIGDTKLFKSRAWVMAVNHFANGRPMKQSWLNCNYDYTDMNGAGTRGIYKIFILENNILYWVSDPRSWRKTERYFCVVDGFELKKLTAEKAMEWVG